MAALTDKEKKQRQRARQKQMGMSPVEVLLSERERSEIERNRHIRGGFRGPYDLGEYVATLIRNDTKALDKQLKDLKPCEDCRLPLPEGCAGVCYGQDKCFHTRRARELKI